MTTRRGLAALIALSIPLAACGSSKDPPANGGSGGTTANAADYTRAMKFASCRRTHGVPNFPDPSANGSGGKAIAKTPGGTKVNGVSVNGPAFQSGMQACRSYLPNGGHPKPLSAAQRTQALAMSQCMRAHGITNFPDPSFQDGGARIQLGSSTGLNPQSPAFQAAQKACGAAFGKVSRAP